MTKTERDEAILADSEAGLPIRQIINKHNSSHGYVTKLLDVHRRHQELISRGVLSPLSTPPEVFRQPVEVPQEMPRTRQVTPSGVVCDTGKRCPPRRCTACGATVIIWPCQGCAVERLKASRKLLRGAN